MSNVSIIIPGVILSNSRYFDFKTPTVSPMIVIAIPVICMVDSCSPNIRKMPIAVMAGERLLIMDEVTMPKSFTP